MVDRKTLEVIYFVILFHSGAIFSKARLHKLLFLLDRYFFLKKGKPITRITYKNYFFGPFSSEIDEALEYLQKRGYLRITKQYAADPPQYVLKLRAQLPYTVLSNEDIKQIEDFIIENGYAEKTFDNILKEIYSTEEYKNTDFGETIEFHL